MSSSGKESLSKHFKNRIFETFVKPKKGDYTNIYSTRFAKPKYLKGKIQRGTIVTVTNTFEDSILCYVVLEDGSDGYISCDNLNKGIDDVEIKAKDLISLGEECYIDWNNREYDACSFTNSELLIESALIGLKQNPKIKDHFYENIKNIITNFGKKFIWDKEIRDNEIRCVGKDFGEFLFGIAALTNNENCFSQTILGSKIIEIIIPRISNFPTVDCFIILENDETIPISLKFDKGSKSSIINGICKPLYINKTKLPNSILSDVISFYEPGKLEAINTIYSYVFKNMLDESPKLGIKLYNEVLCMEQTKNINTLNIGISNDLQRVINKVEISKVSDDIKSKLPHSLTIFCAQMLSDVTNKCEESKNIIINTLKEKNVHLVTLCKPELYNGNIFFDIVKIDKLRKVNISRGKAPMNTITGRNGLYTFECI